MTRWFLDACSLINLYASGYLHSVAQRQDAPFLIVNTVMDEANWIYSRDGLTRGSREAIGYAPLMEAGVLVVVPSTPAVMRSFIERAAFLDDGEAMTLAAALETPGAGIVTDDEAAVPHLLRAGVPLTNSLTLLRQVLDGLPECQRREALLNVRICARYMPGPQHQESMWWRGVLQRGIPQRHE